MVVPPHWLVDIVCWDGDNWGVYHPPSQQCVPVHCYTAGFFTLKFQMRVVQDPLWSCADDNRRAYGSVIQEWVRTSWSWRCNICLVFLKQFIVTEHNCSVATAWVWNTITHNIWSFHKGADAGWRRRISNIRTWWHVPSWCWWCHTITRLATCQVIIFLSHRPQNLLFNINIFSFIYKISTSY